MSGIGLHRHDDGMIINYKKLKLLIDHVVKKDNISYTNLAKRMNISSKLILNICSIARNNGRRDLSACTLLSIIDYICRVRGHGYKETINFIWTKEEKS